VAAIALAAVPPPWYAEPPRRRKMDKSITSIVRYEESGDSVRKAVELCHGLDRLPNNPRVVIKPNIVFWTMATAFPKWGVITTSRVVEDMVVLLAERGIGDIAICEGTVLRDPKDKTSQHHAFQTLGYGALGKRYGVRLLSVFERPFESVDLGDGARLKFNTDILNADFVVNLPVLKTHSQAVVSLGIKNLKGTIDLASRKRCHNADPEKDLNFWIAKLADKMPPMLTLLDGIFTAEQGPNIDGIMHRSDILVASADVLSADLVGARILGHEPADVPHLVNAARHRQRPLDLSDVTVVGEPMEAVARYHEYTFPYTEDGMLPANMENMGLKGLSYPKYDLTMCTYCSGVTGVILSSIARAWRGEAFDEVEVLTGKVMNPTPGKNKTVLIGKCIYQKHKDNPNLKEALAVKGCPPRPRSIVKALREAGIDIDTYALENLDMVPGFFMRRYRGKPAFDESLFRIDA